MSALERMPTITRAEFLRAPAAALSRSVAEGPIVVLGEDQKPLAIVGASLPEAEPDSPDLDKEAERLRMIRNDAMTKSRTDVGLSALPICPMSIAPELEKVGWRAVAKEFDALRRFVNSIAF